MCSRRMILPVASMPSGQRTVRLSPLTGAGFEWETLWRCYSRSSGMNHSVWSLVVRQCWLCPAARCRRSCGMTIWVQVRMCESVREMTKKARDLNFDAVAIRHRVTDNFSIERIWRAINILLIAPCFLKRQSIFARSKSARLRHQLRQRLSIVSGGLRPNRG